VDTERHDQGVVRDHHAVDPDHKSKQRRFRPSFLISFVLTGGFLSCGRYPKHTLQANKTTSYSKNHRNMDEIA
jgi:hypothetical protein